MMFQESDCDFVQRHLTEYHDHDRNGGVLNPLQLLRISRHLEQCHECSAKYSEILWTDDIIGSNHVDVPPTAATAKRQAIDIIRPHRISSVVFARWLAIAAMLVTCFLIAFLYLPALGKHSPACHVSSLAAGSHILYRSNGKLYADMNQFACKQMVTDHWMVSPDRLHVAYATSTHALYVIDSSGKNEKPLAMNQQIVALSWSQDSQFIAAISSPDNHAFTLAVYSVRSTTAILLFTPVTFSASAINQDPVWSDDGRWIAFTSGQDDATLLYTMAMDKHAIASTPLNASASDLRWQSQPAATVTWLTHARDGAINGVAAWNPQTADPVARTTIQGITTAAWSPVSDRWALALTDQTIISVTPQTNRSVRLAQIGDTASRLAWLADGQTLLGVSSGKTLWKIAPDGITRIGTHLDSDLFAIAPNETSVAFMQGDQVIIASLHLSSSALSFPLETNESITKFIWDQQGKSLACQVRTPKGMELRFGPIVSPIVMQLATNIDGDSPSWTFVP